MTLEARIEVMVARYGEACSKSQAARILSRSPSTVLAMLTDGRIRYACAGERVDVTSLAEYIEAPAEFDRVTRIKKKHPDCKWIV